MSKTIQASPNKVKLILISLAIAFIGGLLLIGIPGALLLFLANAIFMIFELNPLDQLGEGTWPAAILVSLLWPVMITPLSFYHYRKFPEKSSLSRWLFSLVGSLIFGVFLAVVFMFGKW